MYHLIEGTINWWDTSWSERLEFEKWEKGNKEKSQCVENQCDDIDTDVGYLIPQGWVNYLKKTEFKSHPVYKVGYDYETAVITEINEFI